MFEIFKALNNNTIKVGRKHYHLYDCSGKSIIDNARGYLERTGHTTHTIELGNGWFSIYANPKVK